jgi:hypothetical protein
MCNRAFGATLGNWRARDGTSGVIIKIWRRSSALRALQRHMGRDTLNQRRFCSPAPRRTMTRRACAQLCERRRILRLWHIKCLLRHGRDRQFRWLAGPRRFSEKACRIINT